MFKDKKIVRNEIVHVNTREKLVKSFAPEIKLLCVQLLMGLKHLYAILSSFMLQNLQKFALGKHIMYYLI